MSISICLGPQIELHSGIHSSLEIFPPPGIEYTHAPHSHRFIPYDVDPSQFSPHIHPSLIETVRFADGTVHYAGIHTSRIPVDNGIPWVTDADCLLATLKVGTHYAFGGHYDRETYPAEIIQRRAKLMIRPFLNDFCKGILFHTDYALRLFLAYLHDLEAITAAEEDALRQKLAVVRPTIPAIQPRTDHGSPVRILYTGRTTTEKGSHLIQKIFSELHCQYGRKIHLTAVSPQEAVADRLPYVNYSPILQHWEYLELVAETDIFISPTLYESYGMAMVEAACLGCAVVCSSGSEVDHIGELFQDGKSAFFVENSLSEDEKVSQYTIALSRLIDSPELLDRFKWQNYRNTSTGFLSISARDRLLVKFYQEFINVTAKDQRFSAIENVTDIGNIRSFYLKELLQLAPVTNQNMARSMLV